jgi:hypothetical protein
MNQAYIEQIEHNSGEEKLIKPRPKALVSVTQNLLHILSNVQVSKEVHEMLSSLTKACLDDFSNHSEKFGYPKRVDRFEEDIQGLVQERVKKNTLIRECTYMPTFLRMRNVPNERLKGDHMKLLDDERERIMYKQDEADYELDTDMYNTLEYVTIKFALSNADTNTLLNAMTPVEERFRANMSSIQKAGGYMQLDRNVLLQYCESENQFYYNIITLVKSTRTRDR